MGPFSLIIISFGKIGYGHIRILLIQILVYFKLIFFLKLVNIIEYSLNSILIFVHVLGQVKVYHKADDDMAVKSVSKPSMPRDAICKVLNLQSPMESTSKESSKRCYYCSKHSDDSSMDLCW